MIFLHSEKTTRKVPFVHFIKDTHLTSRSNNSKTVKLLSSSRNNKIPLCA